MSPTMIRTNSTRKTLPPDTYEMEIVGFDYVDVPWTPDPEDRHDNKRVKVTFIVSWPYDDDPDEFDGMELANHYTPVFHCTDPTKQSWLYKLLHAATGGTYQNPPPGDVDFEATVGPAIGKRVRQDITINSSGFNKFDGPAKPVRRGVRARVIDVPSDEPDDIEEIA